MQTKFLLLATGLVALLTVGYFVACPESPMVQLKSPKSDPRIVYDMYVESLCPDCMEFIKTSVTPAIYTEDFSSMAILNFYPYGNAKQVSNLVNGQVVYNFTCQHGANECYGNFIEACALARLNGLDQAKFMSCFENNRQQFGNPWTKSLEICPANFSLSSTELESCANGEEGMNLMHQIATETNNLSPPHNYVPWVVVNGVHDPTIEDAVIEDMLKYTCQNFQGQKPSSCNQFSTKQKPKADNRIVYDFYIESLCPYCMQLIADSVTPAINTTGFDTMAILNFYPYGNARETSSVVNGQVVYNFTCQHGVNECIGNNYEACGLSKLTGLNQAKFMSCFEGNHKNTLNPWAASVSQCSKDFGLDEAWLNTCESGTEGMNLMHALATETNSLQPPHNYVPWIVVNGVHDETIEDQVSTSILEYTCKNYQGTKIEACGQFNIV